MSRKITGLLLLLLAMGALGGCQKVAGQTKEPIKAGTWQTAQTIQPFFYEEYLDQEKYQLEVLPFTNPGDQKTALLAGELDITGTTLVTAIAAAAQGEPIKIVTSLCNKCSALVVGVDTGIENTEDLKGKRIAYVPGTMHHALLLDTLEQAGLDAAKDVELISIDFFDMGQALKEGSIDAFLSGEPYPSQALLEGYGKILSYPYQEESIGTINAAMIVTEDLIKKHPNTVQSLVNAHIDATKALVEDEQKWLSAAYEFGSDKEVMEIAKQNIELSWDIDENFISHTKALAEKMKELGIIKEVPDIAALFDLSFLEKAKKDGR